MKKFTTHQSARSKGAARLKAFVIGHPILHSRSPLIHQFWIRQYGINATYEAFDVAPQDLESFMGRLATGEFVGGNVTIPHKQFVMAYCDHLSDSSRSIGAVNTLCQNKGRITGSNSDHFGFVDNLDQKAPGWAHRLERAIVLGAGGAARAIVHALIKRDVSQIIVLNRSPEKAVSLAEDFGDTVTADHLTSFKHYAATARLVVNASAVGLNGTRFDNLPLEKLPEKALVHDIVYTPLQTPLLAQADELGLQTVDGLGMLLHQAIPGFEMWFGVRPEVTSELRVMVEREITGR